MGKLFQLHEKDTDETTPKLLISDYLSLSPEENTMMRNAGLFQFVDELKNRFSTRLTRYWDPISERHYPTDEALKYDFYSPEGYGVFSRGLASAMEAQFPWDNLRVFTPDDIKTIALEAGLTVYDKKHPSPYKDLYFDEGYMLLVNFGESIEESRIRKGFVPFYFCAESYFDTKTIFHEISFYPTAGTNEVQLHVGLQCQAHHSMGLATNTIDVIRQHGFLNIPNYTLPERVIRLAEGPWNKEHIGDVFCLESEQRGLVEEYYKQKIAEYNRMLESL